jgi:hypothetical protein
MKYLHPLVEQHGKQMFDAQAIPTDPCLLQLQSYKAFLVERRKRIAARLNNFLQE